jgi:hypothetical protein
MAVLGGASLWVPDLERNGKMPTTGALPGSPLRETTDFPLQTDL